MEDQFDCVSFPSLLGSQGCTAYDVVINQEFFQKCKVCVFLYRVVVKLILAQKGKENRNSKQIFQLTRIEYRILEYYM